MAVKLSDLPTITFCTNNAILVLENDPSGSPTTSGITVQNFFSNVNVNTSISGTFTVSNTVTFTNSNTHISNLHITYNTTPANSTSSVLAGKVWADEEYLYVAVSNNNIKRIALTSF